MKPTALLLLSGIAICLVVVIFTQQNPVQTPKSSATSAATTTEQEHNHSSPSSPQNPPTASDDATIIDIQITDQVVGDGAEAVFGKRVTVQYTGWLYDNDEADKKGLEFDSSVGGEPFKFVLGRSEVISGWDEGVKGMKVGGKRNLIIPSNMGYGPQGSGKIPPNAVLVFDVEVLRVE
jgi:FKBP-type peptidyl-prolyl cis-trans isomerase FkpA